jgi:MFS family permease
MLVLFTGLSATYAGTDNQAGQGVAVASLYLFITFYALCVDATSYIYCAEIFPTSLRSQGMAASIFALFGTTLLYTEVAATAFAHIGWKYYLVFIIVPALGLPIVYRLPETKGLSLEEVAAVFGDEVVLDLTHMNTTDKAALNEELRTGGNVNALDEIAEHRYHSTHQGIDEKPDKQQLDHSFAVNRGA